MSIFLGFNLFTFIKKYQRISSTTYQYEYSDCDSAFRNKDYIGILDMVTHNKIEQKQSRKDLSEYEAFYYCYENAIYYNLYRQAAEKEKFAKKYQRRMLKWKQQLSNKKFLDVITVLEGGGI